MTPNFNRYELPLAYMVISASPRDPGEYMDQLGRFGAPPRHRNEAGCFAMQEHACGIAQQLSIARAMHLARLKPCLACTPSSPDPCAETTSVVRFRAITNDALRRHAIDTHLSRWPAALANLYAAGDDHFDACLKLARERGLLRQLLALTGPPTAGQVCGPGAAC